MFGPAKARKTHLFNCLERTMSCDKYMKKEIAALKTKYFSNLFKSSISYKKTLPLDYFIIKHAEYLKNVRQKSRSNISEK